MTEGTRSNLWVAMREAIAQLRPSIVVWENVRGAYSAEAASGLVDDARLLADTRRRDGEPVLRALGRVLGDLSDLGYDARWHGLRAADVGAPHGRFRVFVVATDAGSTGRNVGRVAAPLQSGVGWSRDRSAGSSGVGAAGEAVPTLLPTPTTRDHKGHNQRRDDTCLTGALLNTPTAADAIRVNVSNRARELYGATTLGEQAVSLEARRLLPTPTSQAAKHAGGDTDRGPGTPDDANLWIIVDRLAKETSDAHSTEDRPGEDVRGVRGADVPQEVRSEARGSDALPVTEDLLAVMREHADGGREGHAPLAGQEAQGPDLSGLRNDGAVARSPRGPESREQRPGESDDALRELSPETALAGGPRGVDWGPYTAAIHRWELILGHPAPLPTQMSAKGNPQLSPRFVEFLMGLPAGWVTDVPGITRNEALKALGNGVVPQQCAAALREMFSWEAVA